MCHLDELITTVFKLLLLTLTLSSPRIQSQEAPSTFDSGNQPGSSERFVRVQTENGWLRGWRSRVRDRKDILSFLGVRYASPPVGEKRFAAPEPPVSWRGVQDALRHGADCFSLRDYTFPGFQGSEMWNADTPFSEDCLNLNIWAPLDAKNASVLVWIFGGGFFSGSPSLELYDGSYLAAEGNIVVVAINYRLGPFGFIYFGEDSANYGLLDQQMALSWISKNIHHFGGDPHQVTLFGESAGAASVSAHLFAVDSWPLFRYAILQSGSINCHWATKTPEQIRDVTTKFLDMIGCANGSDSDRTACARKIKAIDLNNAYQKLSATATLMEFFFVPVAVDSTFFRGDVRKLLEEGKFKKTAVIIGTTVDEGTFWLPYYLPEYFNNQSDGIIDRNQYWNGVQTIFSDYYFYPSVVRKAIAYQYLWSAEVEDPAENPWNPSRTLYRTAISKLMSDYFFSCQTLDFGDELTAHGAVVYTYYFKERSTANVWPEWMGVMHGYELEYFFGVPLRKPFSYTPQEVEFSRKMMHYWISFSKHGEPRLLEPSKRGIRSQAIEPHQHHHQGIPHWPIYGPEKRFLILQSTPLKSWIDRRSDNDDCGFWREIKRTCQSEAVQEKATSGNPSRRTTNSGVRLSSSYFYVVQVCAIGILCYLLSRNDCIH